MPGYFIYCRKSSEAEDRQVLSIESQTHDLQELAAKLNLPIAEILTESKSAKEPGRLVFNDMMQRLYRGEAAGIICWKLDRLARNPVDGGSIIWAIKQHGIKVMTPAQSYAREDDNIILMYIEFGMAQKYVDDLSKNVKRGLKTKAEKGWFPSTPPSGYLSNKVRLTGEINVVTDPERFPLVRRMWDLMLTGLYTPPQILEIANKKWGFRTRPTRKQGGKEIARSAIYEIFTKPFYYGWFEFPKRSGRWYKGNHEPMVTEAEYDHVQTLLGRKGNPRPRTHGVFPFTGLIRCGECKGMVTAEEKHQLMCGNCRFKFAYRRKKSCPRCHTSIEKMSKPHFLHYIYYHCGKSKNPSCTQKSVSAEKLEKQIDHCLSRIQISERFKDWAINFLHELHEKETAFRNEVIQTQQKAYQECVRRIDNLVTLKTAPHNADGCLLSDEEYGLQRMGLLKKKAALEETLQDAGHLVEKCLERSEKSFDFACTARNRFANGDCETKKEILAAMGSNLILKDKMLSIQALKPFLILETTFHGHDTSNEPIEPENIGPTHTQKLLNDSLRPNMCGSRDDVRTLEHKAERAAALIYAHFKKEFGDRFKRDGRNN
jgi:DNA invertase Pin-like site-specific DNA recombinase